MKTLWTDGSASPNPGPGGFCVIEERKGEHGTEAEVVRVGSEKNSSNIRMEGAALIAAMEFAGGEECVINTDSQFWVNVLEQWARGWGAKGWVKRGGEIKNLEMVKEAWKLYTRGNVQLNWVRGHVGTELNEMADEYANKARGGFRLKEESEILKEILKN